MAKGKKKSVDVRSKKDIPEFEKILSKGPITIVLIYADWCGHCTNFKKDIWQNLEDLLNLHQPDLIVVGRPRNLEGEKTKQTDEAEKFASKLSKLYNNKIELIDEALSTEQAKQRIPKSLANKYREVIDQYAACIILESYLKEKK